MELLPLGKIQNYMSELKSWALDGNSIMKEFSFNDFKGAVTFLNKVSEISEKHNHHPDVIMNNKIVRISLTTHSESGLSEKDFDVAKDIDAL